MEKSPEGNPDPNESSLNPRNLSNIDPQETLNGTTSYSPLPGSDRILIPQNLNPAFSATLTQEQTPAFSQGSNHLLTTLLQNFLARGGNLTSLLTPPINLPSPTAPPATTHQTPLVNQTVDDSPIIPNPPTSQIPPTVTVPPVSITPPPCSQTPSTIIPSPNRDTPPLPATSAPLTTTSAGFVTIDDMQKFFLSQAARFPLAPILEHDKGTPLLESLYLAPFPPGYTAPLKFRQYDGKKGNPREHVSRFIENLGIHGGDLTLRLKEFPKSLSDKAYTWYWDLPANSISTWQQLNELFCAKFFVTKTRLTIAELAKERQSPGEDLMVYIRRFRDRSLDCREPVSEIQLTQMCAELKSRMW